ncbi:hypothetical protein QFZ75_001698 [Streptomyces sp. V3I8]|nr:hypothetical protein [Streptomyces sp. V3I8]
MPTAGAPVQSPVRVETPHALSSGSRSSMLPTPTRCYQHAHSQHALNSL